MTSDFGLEDQIITNSIQADEVLLIHSETDDHSQGALLHTSNNCA